jgi:hypothetical protein
VYVEQLAHLGGGAAGFEPDPQRLDQPLAPVGADLRDGREFAPGELVEEDRVGEEPQGDEVVLAEDDGCVVDDFRR